MTADTRRCVVVVTDNGDVCDVSSDAADFALVQIVTVVSFAASVKLSVVINVVLFA